jgi:ribosomal protein S18 acetylase RimI-like enzyme
VTIRELGVDDLPFLRAMLLAALFWTPANERYPDELVLAHPQVSIFHEGWGRAGDAGLVAEVEGERAGAVWYRLFTEGSHGEGFVDERTPELAVAVSEGHRGRGIGRALLEAMSERGRADGFERLSLSVDDDNPARGLYARLGYAAYEPGDGLGRMVLVL